MKIVFVENLHKNWYKTAMKWVTGCPKHHVGFLCEESGIMYDMSLQRRHRTFSSVVASHTGKLFTIIEAPVNVSEAFLIGKETNSDHYGTLDYVYFLLKPLYHLVGKMTRNQDGIICSEQVELDLRSNGWIYHFPEVPSPCDLFNGLIKYYVANNIGYNLTLIKGGTGEVIKS